MIKLTEDHQMLTPYSIHDAVINGYQYSYSEKSLEMQVKSVAGDEYRIIISGIKDIKVEFWEALIIFTLFAFKADKVSVHDHSLNYALNKLFYQDDTTKNLQEFSTRYPDSYLFYLTSSYGGEVAVIADSIEFLPKKQ